MFLIRRVVQMHNNLGSRAKSQFIGSGVCGMPRVRISQKEKLFLTCLLFGFWFPYPIWVLWHMDYYKNPNQYKSE